MVSSIRLNAAYADVRQAIYDAASATGVDFAYLVNQARVESGFNSGARATTSSATGLYQFIDQSWLGVVAKHGEAHGLGWAASAITRGSDGRYRVSDPDMRQAILDLRRDPQAASAMAAELASDNRNYLEAQLNRTVESVDLYLAHFLGAAGAAKFLKANDADPSQAAADLFPAAARSNRGVFFNRDGTARSLGDVRARFAAKFEGASPAADYVHYTELVSAPISKKDQKALDAQWTLKQVQGDSVKANARLAYLMLASLGVSA